MNKRTPFYDYHVKHGAKITEFSGFDMPLQYKMIRDEHLLVRNSVGIFDVSHMGEIEVTGPEARQYLNYLITNDINKLHPFFSIYTCLCDESGGTIDDLIIYQLGDNHFLCCVNAGNIEKDFQWMTQVAKEFQCTVRNISDQYAQLAVQGKKAAELMHCIFPDATHLKRFEAKYDNFMDNDVLVSRTGYTGEDGFELYFPPVISSPLLDAFLNSNTTINVALCGLGARDSLRLEAHYPLYGHELSPTITPIEAGLQFAVAAHKDRFMGRDTLLTQIQKGVQKKIIYFKINDKRIPRIGYEIIDEQGAPIGHVVSGCYSPVTDCGIGSALIQNSHGNHLFLKIREDKMPIIFKNMS